MWTPSPESLPGATGRPGPKDRPGRGPTCPLFGQPDLLVAPPPLPVARPPDGPPPTTADYPAAGRSVAADRPVVAGLSDWRAAARSVWSGSRTLRNHRPNRSVRPPRAPVVTSPASRNNSPGPSARWRTASWEPSPRLSPGRGCSWSSPPSCGVPAACSCGSSASRSASASTTRTRPAPDRLLPRTVRRARPGPARPPPGRAVPARRCSGWWPASRLMSGLYLSALGLGPAANAILLQNIGPVLGLPDRRLPAGRPGRPPELAGDPAGAVSGRW